MLSWPVNELGIERPGAACTYAFNMATFREKSKATLCRWSRPDKLVRVTEGFLGA